MPNARKEDPYRQFRYRVELKGVTTAQFSEATIPDTTQDPIEYRVGNELITVRKIPGLIKYGNVTLKWGTTDNMDMWKWRKLVEDGKLKDARKSMAIVLLDELGKDAARWEFVNAWPTKYDAPDLNAKTDEVTIETVEICHEGMIRKK